MRMYAGAGDLRRVCDLLAALDRPTLHPGDFQWRAGAPDLALAGNLALWEDAGGGLVGFALVQPPWRMLDYGMLPSAQALEPEILGWAVGRIQQWVTARGRAFHWYTSAAEDDVARSARLVRHGFQPQPGGNTFLHRPLDATLPLPMLPEGFSVRPLAGVAEAPAYVAAHRAAFPFHNMSAAWREETLRMPYYDPDLDLVVVAPNGTLAAFGLFWRHPARPAMGELEPAGTRWAFQRLGLARALFWEGCRRLRARGAAWIMGQVAGSSDDAVRFYTSVGATRDYQMREYIRDFAPAPN